MKERDKTRKCSYCFARFGEKAFRKRLRNICDSCARMRVRDRCRSCNGPKLKKRCSKCDPPPRDKVEVIILDKTSDEERVLYRSKDKSGRIQVAGRRFYAVEDPIVLSLSRKEFLSTLC